MKNSAIVLVVAAAAAFGSSCRRKPAVEPPVAIPSVSLAQNKAPLGSPIDVTYRFEVAADAPAFQENYRVFVGVVDADEEIMWHDDHDPPIPTTQWKPGQKIEYTRTVFIPIYPYVGDAAIHMGLHSTKTQKRLTLGGQDVGQRAYMVGKLQLLPQSDNVLLVFKDGWHGIETPPDNPRVEWQWTKKKEATVAFKNPKKDSIVYLSLDNPSQAFPEGQKVQLQLGGQVIDDFTLPPERELMHKIPVTASQFGPEDMAELKVLVDKTFVPALLQPPPNKDPRELGVRIFHIFVQPGK
jgi:hypothetical protein